jgi:methylisocitrate lyase
MEGERPLQVVGTTNAHHALLAGIAGFRAIYLSGGGVSAGSLGVPDLGISELEDVLTDVRRITNVCSLPLLVDVDTGFGPSAFNIARTTKSLIKSGVAAMHIEDQVGAKRCGHRPNKELVSRQEMADRIKAAVDARSDLSFVVMARTDALARNYEPTRPLHKQRAFRYWQTSLSLEQHRSSQPRNSPVLASGLPCIPFPRFVQ